MGKLVISEREELHRVWNLVVPVNSLLTNSPFKLIPPLTKCTSRKAKKIKARKLPISN
jgi:hypothetical protein